MHNPTCLKCKTLVDSSYLLQFGRCKTCFDDLVTRADVLSPPDGLLVRVSYHPGFAVDLTCWTTEYFADGRVCQTIDWYPKARQKHEPAELEGRMSASDIERIHDLLSGIDLVGLAVLKSLVCIDDAGFVHLFAPAYKLHISVDQWRSSDGDLPAEALAAFDAFQTAWDLLDSLSPYTLSAHWRTNDGK